jgi:hypothetical protein
MSQLVRDIELAHRLAGDSCGRSCRHGGAGMTDDRIPFRAMLIGLAVVLVLVVVAI